MICTKCNTNFDMKTEGMYCPKCGEIVKLKFFDDASLATRYIFDLFGEDVLKNGKKFVSLIGDVIPKLTKEKNLFAAMYRENIYTVIYNAHNKDDGEKTTALLVSIKQLMDNEGIAESSAISAVNFISYGLNWSINITSNILENYINTSANQNCMPSTINQKNNNSNTTNNYNQPTIVSNISTKPTLFGKILKRLFKSPGKAVIAVSFVIVFVISGFFIINRFKYSNNMFIDREGTINDADTYSSTSVPTATTTPSATLSSYSSDISNGDVFNETITMSTKDTKWKFKSGVEICQVADYSNSDYDELCIVYEIKNPTKYRIKLNSSNGLMFNKQNEIVNKNSGGYFSSYTAPIEPQSESLIQIECFIDIYGNIPISELGKITQNITLEASEYILEDRVSITDISFEGGEIKYKIKVGNIAPNEYIYYTIKFLNKKGKLLFQYYGSDSDLIPNTVEVKEVSPSIRSTDDTEYTKVIATVYKGV